MKTLYKILGYGILVAFVLLFSAYSATVIGIGFVDSILYVLDVETIIAWTPEKIPAAIILFVVAVMHLGYLLAKAGE